jgi:hypothetical protein
LLLHLPPPAIVRASVVKAHVSRRKDVRAEAHDRGCEASNLRDDPESTSCPRVGEMASDLASVHILPGVCS